MKPGPDPRKELSLRALAWSKENMLPGDGENAEDIIRKDRDSR